MNQSHSTIGKNASCIIVLLFLLFLGSVIALLLPRKAPGGYIAEIYQSGTLLWRIPLSDIEESYTFTVEGNHGGNNKIEVRPGSIGIISADCPDQICVNQGFISDSRLPITCLPNKIVIWLRPASDAYTEPDILTY